MQIKFRARIKENGKPKMFYQNDQYLNSFLRRVSGFLYYEKDGEEKHESYLEDHELEKSLDMFTGLKDKNGKEIYEGDILVAPEVDYDYDEQSLVETGNKETREIKWDNEEGSWSFGNNRFQFKEAEIIGNIYENPNLIN